MEQSPELMGYLIPLVVVSAFALFPVLMWLSKKDETKKEKH